MKYKLETLPFWDFFKSLDSYPKYFDTQTYWLYVVMSIAIILLIFVVLWIFFVMAYDLCDHITSTTKRLTGVLVDKKYIGERSSSGIGTVVIPSTNGPVIGLIPKRSYGAEEFLFFVDADKMYKIPVDMQTFYKKDVGYWTTFEVTIGGLSKEDLRVELFKID